jgi:dihydroorotate dehydrogenase electron transfer subunit
MYTTGKIYGFRRIKQVFCELSVKLDVDLRRVLPLQFVMVGIPGEFEVPLSVSMYERDTKTLRLFFKIKGRIMENLCGGVKYVSVRGPYGKGRLDLIVGDRVLYIAEDVGFPPIPLLTSWVREHGKVLDLVMVFEDKVEFFDIRELTSVDLGGSVAYYTKEDIKNGLISTIKPTSGHAWETIIAVGDRVLLREACELAKKFKASGLIAPVVRIKCGLGACGYCVIPKTRYLSCVEGPVFSCRELASYLGLEHGD